MGEKKKSAVKPRKRKKLVDPIAICVQVETRVIEFIKKQAHLKSIETGIGVSHADLIRQALENAFDFNNQRDMFDREIQ